MLHTLIFDSSIFFSLDSAQEEIRRLKSSSLLIDDYESQIRRLRGEVNILRDEKTLLLTGLKTFVLVTPNWFAFTLFAFISFQVVINFFRLWCKNVEPTIPVIFCIILQISEATQRKEKEVCKAMHVWSFFHVWIGEAVVSRLREFSSYVSRLCVRNSVDNALFNLI